MQRIRVDLPEPDGPQITMRSPRWTLRLMSRSTWNSPYHLLTPASSMITSASAAARLSAASVMAFSSPAHVLLQLGLEPLAVFRHEEAEAEIDQRDEQIDLDVVGAPRRVV